MSPSLSPTQRAALVKLYSEHGNSRANRSGVWDFGSTTINRLRLWGFVRVDDSVVYITADGCRAIGKEHPDAADARRFREDAAK